MDLKQLYTVCILEIEYPQKSLVKDYICTFRIIL
jgi:hypothetical protein